MTTGAEGVPPVTTGPAVFLDRDGVINKAVVRQGRPHPPDTLDELEILPGVAEGLQRLKTAGFALVVVTNQPDVARGRQTAAVVAALHHALAQQLPIDEFRVCFHDDADACGCRKPKPGLLTRAPHYDLPHSFMVGDRWRDIEAGRRAGVQGAILVEYGYDEALSAEPDVRLRSLLEAADWILATVAAARDK
ncbi:MAG: HAD-IIIA family hydrolase [Vicinamibacterales bacterium]